MVLNLSESEVRELLDLHALIRAMERALAAFSLGEVDQPVRAVVDVGPGRGFFGAMPAHLREGDSLGTKLVTVFHENVERGLPSHMATILLFDPRTGALLAIMDGRYITEVRTAAVSAVSARLLARRETVITGILGSGVQARSHAAALRLVMPQIKLRAWSPNRDNLARFAAECDLEASASARVAVEGADIVVLVTASTTPVLEADWVRPGAHVIAAGACRPNHREMPEELVRRARVFVDSRAAAVKEAGDIVMSGLEQHIAGELGELIAGRVAGRTADDQITIFKSLGLAVEDVAAARMVYDRALMR